MKSTITIMLIGLLLIGGIAPLAMALTQGVKLNAKVGSDTLVANELSVSASEIAVDSGFNANLVSDDITSVDVNSETKARLGYPKFALVFRGMTDDNEAVSGYLISMKTRSNDLSVSSELFKGRLKVGSESYVVSGKSLTELEVVSLTGSNANSVSSRGELSLDLANKVGALVIDNQTTDFKILRAERTAVNPSMNARDDKRQNANEDANPSVLKRILDRNANANADAEANADVRVNANEKRANFFERLRIWFSRSNTDNNAERN